MRAKGGKGIDITTHGDSRRVFLKEDGRIYYEDGTPADHPLKPGYINLLHDRQYANLMPPPSALDSIWQAIWTWLRDAW